jgi:hypothetical protein
MTAGDGLYGKALELDQGACGPPLSGGPFAPFLSALLAAGECAQLNKARAPDYHESPELQCCSRG